MGVLAIVLTSTVSQYTVDALPGLTVSLTALTKLVFQGQVLRTERAIFKLCACEQEEGEGAACRLVINQK